MDAKHRIIACLLLMVSLLVLAVPVVPHHHHDDTLICMKNDAPADCGCHAGHCYGNHAECNDTCATNIQPLAPGHNHTSDETVAQQSITLHLLAYFIFCLLFTQKQTPFFFIYHESLRGTWNHAFSLRGPPYC